jgi:chemosensory pili system protein ChpA (sensor histidine kinase/response regulator)
MSDVTTDDIQIDFINELKGYIPVLRDKVNKLAGPCSADSDEDLTELHRLVHTIRGASALVKLNNLCAVASEFEQVVENIINKRLNFDTAVFKAAGSTIDFFDAYSNALPFNDAFDQTLMDQILGQLFDIRKLITNSDGPDLLSQLLRSADQNEDDTFGINGDELAFEHMDLISDPLMADEAFLADDVACEAEWDAPEESGPAGENTFPVDFAVENSGGSDSLEPFQQELLEGFYQEAEDHFQDVGKALGKLEDCIKGPVALTPDYKELIRLIRRSVHTIKGAAAVIKLKPIASWGHEFEDVLDWLYDGADALTPEVITVLAEATDILERFVTTPQEIDARKVDRVRTEFQLIIGAPLNSETVDTQAAVTEHPLISSHVDEVTRLDHSQDLLAEGAGGKAGPQAPSMGLGLDQVKTLRVDVTKVESVVNLAGELTIALSAFDQDMEGLGNLIAEIDRARLRLKQTSRDLELGYEVKAIRQLGSNPSMVKDAETAADSETAAFSDFDMLELDRYSELNLIIRSLSETAVDVSTISHQLSGIYSGFDAYLNRLRILLSELHQKSMRMRMTPMSTLINRMSRTVRETAAQLNKKVQLRIHGEHIELDRMVWEKLSDPLMHLLRNAVDHGIESPVARQAAGKPPIAVVHLTAAYQGNQVVIRVSDDGASLDYAAIRKVVASSHGDQTVDAMSETDLADIIFQSGLSTRQTISEISGRGVGLDVVRENIRGLKGSVRVETSAPGTGTTFRINLPLTMAVMQALLFDVGGQHYAASLYDIKEILRVNPKDIEGEKEKTIKIGDRNLPFYQLSEILCSGGTKAPIGNRAQWPLVLIVDTEYWQGAVAIDHMLSKKEIVIKGLGTHLRHVKGIAGATVMGDGKILPILNIEELVRIEADREHLNSHFTFHESQQPLEIMVVDDSVSVRTVVSRLMQRQGWRVMTAKDGVEAIERLHTRRPDLIVLDVEMPRMNGYEFMSSIRTQAKFKDMPVIMLTSRTSKKHRTKAQALGVNGFVTKPYDDEAFIALVKRLSEANETSCARREETTEANYI